MHRLLLVSLFALPSLAQLTATLSGPVTAKQGSSVTLSLSTSGGTATGPAGVQWTLVPPSGFTVSAATAGAQATAASKQVVCNAANLLCLAYGINQNVIANGQVASLTVQVPANATPGSAAFSLAGLVAGDRAGAVIGVTAGTPYTLVVLARADIDGSGSVDASDVSAMAGQITGGTCADDQNADGKCDLIDVLVVVLRALGV